MYSNRMMLNDHTLMRMIWHNEEHAPSAFKKEEKTQQNSQPDVKLLGHSRLNTQEFQIPVIIIFLGHYQAWQARDKFLG